MKKTVNECCGCAVPGYPCSPTCTLKAVEHYYCDKCGSDIDLDEVYEADEEDLCLDCLKDRFKKAV